MVKRYATIPGGRLAYDEAGRGSAVVLMHAGIADRRMWDDQMSALARRFRVIRFDFRSFGESPRGDPPIRHHRDLYGLLNALEVERASLIGVSIGAAVAVDFTLEYPERVLRLVLVGPGICGLDLTSAFERYGGPIREAARAKDDAKLIEAHLRLWVDGLGRRAAQVDPQVRERLREMVGGSLRADDGKPLDPPAVGRLSEIAVPTLVVVGDQDLPEIKERADILARRIRGARKVTMKNAAHIPNMEHPDEFNRIVLEFLGGSAVG